VKALLRLLVASSLLFVGIAGCASEPTDGEEDEDSIAESEDHLLAGRRLSERQIATLVRKAGFPESEVGKMVCAAKWESSFYEKASNKNNRNRTSDHGLFQINTVHLGSPGCPTSVNPLYDASVNTRCAYAVWKAQTITAWNGYKKHKAECDAYRAPPSTAAPPPEQDDDQAGEGGCWSGTLTEMVEARTCVQSKFNRVWFQCMNGKWYRGVKNNAGPHAACNGAHPLR